MSKFSRACCISLAAFACGAAFAAQEWAVSGGTIRLSLDAGKFKSLGLAAPISVDSGAATFDLTVVVTPSESDLRIFTQDDATLRQAGYLRTSGEFFLETGLEPNGAPSQVGNFIFEISGQHGTVIDGASLGRQLFELNSADLDVRVDAKSGTGQITGELLMSKSFAHEVLGQPALTGMPLGVLRSDVTIALAGPPVGLGGIAGGTANGPDVIVSTVSSFTRYGNIGGISAYAMTTVSCNLGEADAIWIDCSSGPQCNQHPVIGQNLYRLKGGRFEHIGQAWLKHGFCAADAPSCGSPYESNGSCDWLGTHATDTYGASLNASQTNLGPKSEINPWTGVFPYPFVLGAGVGGSAINKRLQVANVDIDPAQNAGALYYGESQYVVTDEQPLNRYNNVSYRPASVTVSGSNFNITYTGSTITQQPAINAWAAADAAVTLIAADATNDGRFILGYKASDNGNGTWHYEFAVFNMNCRAAGQAFSVPIPAGVVVTNIGFHDVDYHSGEVYANTDWTATQSGGMLTWATQTKAQNINANALRWGTLYNFRFDANSAPTSADVSLALFDASETLEIAAVAPSTTCQIPVVITEPQSQVVSVGSAVSIDVVANGSNPLSYQWYKDGDELSGATNSNVQFAAVNYSDAGEYSVVISNTCGSTQSATVSLTVNPVCLKGDSNCDGVVNNFDIDYFVNAVLNNIVAYNALGGTQACWDIRHCWGDLNGIDGLNNFDIDGFVACILSPPSSGQPCP